MVGPFLKKATVLIIFCQFFVKGEDLLEHFRPDPSLPEELNEWLIQVQEHKGDFRLIRDSVEDAPKKLIHFEEEDADANTENLDDVYIRDVHHERKSNINERPQNDIYPYMFHDGKEEVPSFAKTFLRKRKLGSRNSPIRLRRSSNLEPFFEFGNSVKVKSAGTVGELKRSDAKYPDSYNRKEENVLGNSNIVRNNNYHSKKEDTKLSESSEKEDTKSSEVKKREIQIDIKNNGKLLKQIHEDAKNPKSIVLNIQSPEVAREALTNPKFVDPTLTFESKYKDLELTPQETPETPLKNKEFLNNFKNLFTANEHLNTDSSLAQENSTSSNVLHIQPFNNPSAPIPRIENYVPNGLTGNVNKNIDSNQQNNFNGNNMRDMSSFWTSYEKKQMQKGLDKARFNKNVLAQNVKSPPNIKDGFKIKQSASGFEPAQKIELDSDSEENSDEAGVPMNRINDGNSINKLNYLKAMQANNIDNAESMQFMGALNNANNMDVTKVTSTGNNAIDLTEDKSVDTGFNKTRDTSRLQAKRELEVPAANLHLGNNEYLANSVSLPITVDENLIQANNQYGTADKRDDKKNLFEKVYPLERDNSTADLSLNPVVSGNLILNEPSNTGDNINIEVDAQPLGNEENIPNSEYNAPIPIDTFAGEDYSNGGIAPVRDTEAELPPALNVNPVQGYFANDHSHKPSKHVKTIIRKIDKNLKNDKRVTEFQTITEIDYTVEDDENDVKKEYEDEQDSLNEDEACQNLETYDDGKLHNEEETNPDLNAVHHEQGIPLNVVNGNGRHRIHHKDNNYEEFIENNRERKFPRKEQQSFSYANTHDESPQKENVDDEVNMYLSKEPKKDEENCQQNNRISKSNGNRNENKKVNGNFAGTGHHREPSNHHEPSYRNLMHHQDINIQNHHELHGNEHFQANTKIHSHAPEKFMLVPPKKRKPIGSKIRRLSRSYFSKAQASPELIIRKRDHHKKHAKKKHKKKHHKHKPFIDYSHDYGNDIDSDKLDDTTNNSNDLIPAFFGRQLQEADYEYDAYLHLPGANLDEQLSTAVPEISSKKSRKEHKGSTRRSKPRNKGRKNGILHKNSVEGDYGEEEDSVTVPHKKNGVTIIRKTDNEFADPLTTTEEEDYSDYEDYDTLTAVEEERPKLKKKRQKTGNRHKDKSENIDKQSGEPRDHDVKSFGHHRHKHKPRVKPHKHSHSSLIEDKNGGDMISGEAPSPLHQAHANKFVNQKFADSKSDFQHWPSFVIDDHENEEKLRKRSPTQKNKYPSAFTFPLSSNDFFVKAHQKGKRLQVKRDKSNSLLVDEILKTDKPFELNHTIIGNGVNFTGSTEDDDDFCSTKPSVTEECEDRDNFYNTSAEITTILSIEAETAMYTNNACDTDLDGNNTETQETLEDMINGRMAFEVIRSMREKVRQNEKLNKRFHENLKQSNVDSNFLHGLNDTNVESERLVKSMRNIMHQLQLSANCHALPRGLRRYLHIITRANKFDALSKTREMEEIEFDDSQNQESFIFESSSRGNSFEGKVKVLQDLLDRFNKLPEQCKTRALPVKEYIENHLGMLNNMLNSASSREARDKKPEKPIEIEPPFKSEDELIAEQLESLGLGKGRKFTPQFDLDQMVLENKLKKTLITSHISATEQPSNLNVNKRELNSVTRTKSYDTLVDAVRKLRMRREHEKRLGEMFGRSGRESDDYDEFQSNRKGEADGDISKANFEPPLVYSL